MSLTAGEVAGLLSVVLPDRGVVYTADPVTSLYTVVAVPDLACRVLHIVSVGQTQGQRAELAMLRRILFDPDYAMPDDVQVEINGTRYDPLEATFAHLRAGVGVVRRVDAVVVVTET